MAHQHHVQHGIPLTRDNFTSPPLEMGIVPFWFWNGDLDYAELEWQLRQYYDRGVRSLFIHPRMGLNVPYLSEEWFDRVKFAVKMGEEIGIDLWIYDELDWPSGTAGKQVIAANPDLGQRYLELVPLQFEGPLFTFLEAHDDRYVNTGNSNPIAAYGVRQEEWRGSISDLVDLNKNLAWERTIPWEAPPGNWVLLYFLEKRAPYYIDTLYPPSTEKFLELTHDKYRDAVGESFGGSVPGFFTDEPAMYYYHVGLENYVVPWSKQMFGIFRDRRGYDLKPFLPALYADMGPDTVRVRYDFWRTLTEQYAETYYGRIRRWCDENGVIFTGHLLFEEHLRLQARCEGNLFKYLRHLELIGVDHLYPKIGTEKDPAQHVALKVGSSAAHHFGSTRLLCESMGGTYWDCSLERMKWMNNWEYVLGVNLFNNHGYHYTIEGERKRDWPPSQFYHHTWWKYYDQFTTYNARLSHILSGGRHVAKVLMLYPINTIWTDYVPQRRTPIGEVVEQDFEYLTDTLLRLHWDFDYVDEDVLAGASISSGEIGIADETYSILILPPVTYIKEATWKAIQRFVESGGKVIASTLLPVGLLEVGDEDRVEPLPSFYGMDGQAVLDSYLAGTESDARIESAGSGRVAFFQGPGLHVSRPKETLRKLLEESSPPDVKIGAEDVFYLHREKDGFDIYFLVNTTQTDLGRVPISFERLGRPELWDPNTGSTTPISVYDVRDGRLTIQLDFPPSEAHIVVLQGEVELPRVVNADFEVTSFDGGTVSGFALRHGDAFAAVRTPDGEVLLEGQSGPDRPPILFPDEMAFEAEGDNALLLGSFKMQVEEECEIVLDTEGEVSPWLDVTQGAWEMQLPTERAESTYPVTLWYRTHFDLIDMPERIALLVDGFAGEQHTLFLNGEEVADTGERSSLDAEVREIDIRPYVKMGRNSIVVHLIARKRTDGMLDPIKIVGSFGLERMETGSWVIGKPAQRVAVADWTGSGFPFFSGTGCYRTTLEIDETYLDGGRLQLEAECGEDVLEVSINGSPGRIVPWHPYTVEVTDLLRPGKNDVELRVTNTLMNVLEGVQTPSGLRRPPRLIYVPAVRLSLPRN